MRLILNILWFIFGGLLSGLGWILAGVLCAITIIGIPWARACFMLANFSFWPFGRTVMARDVAYGRHDIGTGPFGIIGNIIWFVFFGWWLAAMHLLTGFGLAVTIIGIPFAFQHLKLAGASLFPIGQVVVDIDGIGMMPPQQGPDTAKPVVVDKDAIEHQRNA